MVKCLPNPDSAALAGGKGSKYARSFFNPIFFRMEYNPPTQPSATHVKALAHRGDTRHEKQESNIELHVGRCLGIRRVRPRPRSRR
jgi:hypothetical protein